MLERLFNHFKTNIEKVCRFIYDFLANLEFHALLQRLFQTSIDLIELGLEQFHLEGLKEEGAYFLLERLWQYLQLTHRQVRLVQLLLLVHLLLILD